MINTVTCAKCGRLLAVDIGLFARWNLEPHGSCPSTGVIVRWEYSTPSTPPQEPR